MDGLEDLKDIERSALAAYQQERCARWHGALQDWMAAGFTREEAFELVKVELEENVIAFWAKQAAQEGE